MIILDDPMSDEPATEEERAVCFGKSVRGNCGYVGNRGRS